MKSSRRIRRLRANVRSNRLSLESLEARQMLAGDPILNGEPLIISELVADSSATLLTRTRTSFSEPFEGADIAPDWIELMNVSDQPVDLSGMHLTDDSNDLAKWTFPGGTHLDAGDFIVVFASGQDITTPALDENGFLHTNFRLGSDGEYVALTDVDGRVIHELSPAYPPQRVDASYALPMTAQQMIGPAAPVEYLVPQDDSLGQQWQLPGFTDPNLVKDGVTSPLGFDRGDAPAEAGETLGAELIKRAKIDFSQGSLVVLESRPFSVAGRVEQWSIYSETTNVITPLVLTRVGEEYKIVGVGRARTSDGSGLQTFDFDVQTGSDVVETSGYYFGFKDGDNVSNNAGVVRYDDVRGVGESVRRYSGPLSGSIIPGTELSGGRSLERVFSVQATTKARLAGPINTNVDAAMGSATSLYLRYPFDLLATDATKALTLNIRYEDGFVAYLNGTEVARRNAPNTVGFDSSALENQALEDANQYESINLSEYISALRTGENVLAIQALNESGPGSGDFFLDAQLVGIDLAGATDFGFASDTTPAEPNREVLSGLLDPVEFSHHHGLYEEGFNLQLVAAGHPNAKIYYTLDGTDPTPDNPVATLYQTPLPMGGTTTLRASSYDDDFLPSIPVAQTYIFPQDIIDHNGPNADDDLQSAVKDDPIWGPQLNASLRALPTVSIVTEVPITVGVEVPISLEMFTPDGSEGFQVNAGIEIYGGTAVSFPKRSHRISFKNIYGPSTFEYDLFDDPDGVQVFDQLILRAGSHDTPFWNGATGVGNYIRNRWTNDQQLKQGQPAPRGRFVQLYMNGTYWGQYHLMERPAASFMSENFGGDAADYDALNAAKSVDGDLEAWNELLDAVGESYEAVQQYLDVENYADYILLEWFGGNTVDWGPSSNWMAARRREPGAGFQFFGWDSDIVLRQSIDSDIVNFAGPGFLWSREGGVKQYPEFLKLLAERAQMYFFDDGLFTPEVFRAGIDEVSDPLHVSVIAETARWGSGVYTPKTWEDAIQWIKDTYAPQTGPTRDEIVVEQMRHAGVFPVSDRPEFSVDGQPVSLTDELKPGDMLSMSAPNGEIYYTLDGSDPWEEFPTVNYTHLVGPTSAARVVVPSDDTLQLNWTTPNFDDSTWINGQNGVGFDASTEQALLPLVNTNIQQQMENINGTAYVRLPFQVDDPSRFDSLNFSVRYDDGFVAYLNGVEVARRYAPDTPLWNSVATRAHDTIEAIEFETFNLSREKGLLQAGENVLAIHMLNTTKTVDALVEAKLDAGIVTDAGMAPGALHYDGPLNVPADAVISARTLWGDSWSTLRTAATAVLPLRIAEVMYHPGDPTDAEIAAGHDDADDFEFIELVNVSNVSISLSDVQFVESLVGGEAEGIKFDFGQGAITQLGPGDRVLVVENRAAFEFRYGTSLPVAGQWNGGLRNSSEQITVMDGTRLLQQFTYQDSWHPSTDGQGPSLEIIDESSPYLDGWNEGGNWQPSAVSGGTPGTHGDPRLPGDSNGDGVFDSADLLAVLEAGEYEDDIPNNSTFETGDWNGDGDFTTEDLIYVLQFGHYVNNPPAAAMSSAAVAAALADDELKDSLTSRDRLFEQMAEDEFSI